MNLHFLTNVQGIGKRGPNSYRWMTIGKKTLCMQSTGRFVFDGHISHEPISSPNPMNCDSFRLLKAKFFYQHLTVEKISNVTFSHQMFSQNVGPKCSSFL